MSDAPHTDDWMVCDACDGDGFFPIGTEEPSGPDDLAYCRKCTGLGSLPKPGTPYAEELKENGLE